MIEKKKVRVSLDNPSIGRINEKCITCGICYKTCEEFVGIDHKFDTLNESICINCGQCVLTCPTGALVCKYNYKRVLNFIKDTEKIVTVSIAPAIRSSLGEELGREPGTSLESLLPSILRRLGFDYVFDVTFGADVTIMEEATELIKRLKNKESLPMFTSCCSSWVKYASIFHPEILPNLSTTNSPIEIQSSLIKTYFKEMNNINDDIISVVVAPCTAKKYERIGTDTDIVITTRELAMMIRECGIDINTLRPSIFDSLLSRGSIAGCKFGKSGGVMGAALSTAQYLLTGNNPKENEYYLDISEPITEASYKIGDHIIKVAIVYGMKNLESILPKMDEYDFIEVMNCPNGCVGGGGQPLTTRQNNTSIIDARKGALSNQNEVIFSHMNAEIEDLYNSFLICPMSEKAKNILHKNREPYKKK